MKAGGVAATAPPAEKMLSCGPNAAAWAFIAAGLGTCHRPVARRFSSVCTAVTVSAGVNAQCPARCTKTWRSRLARPAWSTALRYACSFSGTTSPSPVVCMVSTGDRDPAGEGDVLDQVSLGVRAGLDPRRAVQRQQVLGQ